MTDYIFLVHKRNTLSKSFPKGLRFSYHLIGVRLFFISISFVVLNGLLPKKPRYADNGLGCAVRKTWTREVSVIFASLLAFWNVLYACVPHRTKTLSFLVFITARKMADVTSSQPLSLWELAWCALTVSIVFKSKTPCCFQSSRFPLMRCILTSEYNSWYIFLKEGGRGCPSGTEKLNPWACPGSWYGSWPRITTLISSGAKPLMALKIL